MAADVVVIGLDAAEPALLERWAAEGLLPTFAGLVRGGTTVQLANSLETLPGAIWPELSTGVSGGRLGLYYHPAQLHTGEAAPRPVSPTEVDADRYYWSVASAAGRRVAALDQPQTVPSSRLRGVQLFEWGLHDRNFSVATDPPGLLDDLLGRHGEHPVDSCDRHHRQSDDGYLDLRRSLLAGAASKAELATDVLSRGDWDLFACTFGEAHCAGHQFWHFLDPDHPRHRPDAPEPLRSAVTDVYRRLDEGVGAIIEAAGPGARVLVVASHGMGPKIGGPQLLPEVLIRLGMGAVSGARLRLRSAMSPQLRRLVHKALPKGSLDHVPLDVGDSPYRLDSPSKRAITVRNNRCGGIRLNLAGREPEGGVAPGSEADALANELRSELLALRDPASGETIVERVVTAEETFGCAHHPDVPDLMVVFRSDLGPLEACESRRVGRVSIPTFVAQLPRTGDHMVDSHLWAIGPGVPGGTRLAPANVLDVAPTVLRLLGVDLPGDLDGRPLDELVVTVPR
ncbi:alkaline phosphatase family protein [soil metagenome]